MSQRRGSFALAAFALFAPGLDAPQETSRILYVDASASGAATGASWENAFIELRHALAGAGAGDEIWVAAGTYTPADAASSFHLLSGVALYGGFAGGETERSQRDWLANETILSGDVGRDDAPIPPGSPWWYLTWLWKGPNCGHVVVASGVDASAVLDGFTIADGTWGPLGTPIGDPLLYGSGLYNVGGSPTIRNCTFTHNGAYYGPGGALYNLDGTPTLLNCRFVENVAYGGAGGAICNAGTGALVVEDCTFVRNVSLADEETFAYGGGIAHLSTSAIAVVRCTFDENSCGWDHGSAYPPVRQFSAGAGLANVLGSVLVQDCVFTKNYAQFGAGLFTAGPALVVNGLFVDNEAVEVYHVGGTTTVGGFGAGLMSNAAEPDVLIVVNTTIAHNSGRQFVGLMAGGSSHAAIENTILWGNTATNPLVIDTWQEQLGGSFDAAYSCIQNAFDPALDRGPADTAALPGCIDEDPLFVDSVGGRYLLMPASPCIDAADNASVPVGIVRDLRGIPRFIDDPFTPDTGLGGPPTVDMGAYEHSRRFRDARGVPALVAPPRVLR